MPELGCCTTEKKIQEPVASIMSLKTVVSGLSKKRVTRLNSVTAKKAKSKIFLL
jgi:hypothetical protein